MVEGASALVVPPLADADADASAAPAIKLSRIPCSRHTIKYETPYRLSITRHIMTRHIITRHIITRHIMSQPKLYKISRKNTSVTPHSGSKVWIFSDFEYFLKTFFFHHPSFFGNILFCIFIHSFFSRPNQCITPRKHTSYITKNDGKILKKKRIFGGEKGHYPEQSKDLETRIKRPRGTSQI